MKRVFLDDVISFMLTSQLYIITYWWSKVCLNAILILRTSFWCIFKPPLWIFGISKNPKNDFFQQYSWINSWFKRKENLNCSFWRVVGPQTCMKITDSTIICSFLAPPVLLWVVIIFERKINLIWNFQYYLLLDVSFIWQSFREIWDGSCPNSKILVHLTWNDPHVKYEIWDLCCCSQPIKSLIFFVLTIIANTYQSLTVHQ